ncbi:PCNA-interacting partner isoform X1 [Vidua macroura]|uniref:PCNA-interacting partner isoform X1 n=1 Tax=Vidua macroura TaxID=187451 RepID=UPI0023A7EA71|nr:PCNA-interacting partner isoform X1 [Vidua macroura]
MGATGLKHPHRHSSECIVNAESTEDTLKLLLETKAAIFVMAFLYVGIMYKEIWTMVTFQQKILHLVKCFRRQWPLFSNSERTTVCGADCMLMALQLSMAEVNKQHHGDFTVSLSDVLEMWNYLLHDKLGLYENMNEPENYADVKKAYHAFLARSNMLDLIDIYQKCSSLGLLAEDEIISPVQLLEFISGVMNAQENNGSILSTPIQINRQGQEHMKVTILAKKFVCSYLSLLVNSKDDLALAHILNVPDRGLGREAFTNLKHASQERKMSIFLMATSFIRTIELGGRDSASSMYDLLRAHVKGLSNFVNFIDKLQEIVGEVLNTRIAGGRILSTVKMHLIKGRSNGDPFCEAVEEAVQDLDLKIKNIIDSQQETLTASTTGVSPARPKLHSINHGTAYCGRDTVKVLLVLLDEEAVSPPTQNKADLLCDSESLNLCGITSVLTLFRSPARSNGSSPKPLGQRILKCMDEKVIKMKQSSIKSQFACTYKNDLSEKSGQHSHAIPTCKHPVPKQHLKAGKSTGLGTISESVHQTRSYTEMGKLSCQPRNKNSENEQMDLNNDKIICDKESEPSLQKNTKRLKTSNSFKKELDSKIGGKRKQTKTASKNKLIAGQAKLTHFFQL